MRVVLDTNVIIAAFASRGLCAEVFEVCLAEHTLVMSRHILSEVEEKLAIKLRMPENTIRNIVAYLQAAAEVFEHREIGKQICRDKEDDWIIGTALAGNAKVIITGDNDMLVLKKYGKIRIVSPGVFGKF